MLKIFNNWRKIIAYYQKRELDTWGQMQAVKVKCDRLEIKNQKLQNHISDLQKMLSDATASRRMADQFERLASDLAFELAKARRVNPKNPIKALENFILHYRTLAIRS
jgi:uncharacterized protein YigA (DUF484 family)